MPSDGKSALSLRMPSVIYSALHNVRFSKKPIHVFSTGLVSAQKEFVMKSISKYFKNSEILAHSKIV
jgi:hypothetical protein